MLDKNQEPSRWKEFIKGEDEKKMADKQQPKEDQKKEKKPDCNCWKEQDLSSGLLAKKNPSAVQEKQQGEKAEPPCEAKEPKGVHKRNLPERRSEQCQGNELRKASVSRSEKSDGESCDVQQESEPLREKETKPLPQVVHSQNPISHPQEGEHFSKKHPKSWEAGETKAKDNPSMQTAQMGLQGHFQGQSGTRDEPAPKGSVAQSAPPAAGRPLGERREADTSSGDSEEDDVSVSCQPGGPLLCDTSPDSQKKESHKVPSQSVQRKVSPASGVSRKVDPSDPAAQRVHLTTQLKRKKVAPLVCS